MRDRLIELLQNRPIGCTDVGGDGDGWLEVDYETLVDHLLANGVIVPPYKVGTKVYAITSQTSNNENFYIFEDVISHYIVGDYCTVMCFENRLSKTEHNWDKVFLTREDAERALEEMNNAD